jgi:hypothetical protein
MSKPIFRIRVLHGFSSEPSRHREYQMDGVDSEDMPNRNNRKQPPTTYSLPEHTHLHPTRCFVISRMIHVLRVRLSPQASVTLLAS